MPGLRARAAPQRWERPLPESRSDSRAGKKAAGATGGASSHHPIRVQPCRVGQRIAQAALLLAHHAARNLLHAALTYTVTDCTFMRYSLTRAKGRYRPRRAQGEQHVLGGAAT